MQKIPTLFQRDPETSFRTLTRDVHPDCQWVLDGEGVATRKFNGTCVLVKGGCLFKRREIKKGKPEPYGFVFEAEDQETGKRVGWVEVGNGGEDKWHREAVSDGYPPDGTYELCGPKIQGNTEHFESHTLVRHGNESVEDVPRDYNGLADFLTGYGHEGIVWHHPDGRMSKIKRRDFLK